MLENNVYKIQVCHEMDDYIKEYNINFDEEYENNIEN